MIREKVNYPDVINGYKKFLGRKKLIWFQPPFKVWKIGELEIRLNPELGLEYNNQFYVMKLYFKDEKDTTNSSRSDINFIGTSIKKQDKMSLK